MQLEVLPVVEGEPDDEGVVLPRRPLALRVPGGLGSRTLAEIYSNALEPRGVTAGGVSTSSREVVEPGPRTGKVDVVPEYLRAVLRFLGSRCTCAP